MTYTVLSVGLDIQQIRERGSLTAAEKEKKDEYDRMCIQSGIQHAPFLIYCEERLAFSPRPMGDRPLGMCQGVLTPSGPACPVLTPTM